MDLTVQFKHIQESNNIVRTIDTLVLKELLSDLLERDEELKVQSVQEDELSGQQGTKNIELSYNDRPGGFSIGYQFDQPTFEPAIPEPGQWPNFPSPSGHLAFAPLHQSFDTQQLYHTHNPNPEPDEMMMVQDMPTNAVIDQALVDTDHMMDAREIQQDSEDNYECQGARMIPHGLDLEEEIEWYIKDGCPDSLECADALIKQLQHRRDRWYYRRMLTNKKRIQAGESSITIPAAGENKMRAYLYR
jgi:hypothetical protein